MLPCTFTHRLCCKGDQRRRSRAEILVRTQTHTHTPGHSCCVFTGAPHLHSPCVAKPGAAQCLLATVRNFPQKRPFNRRTRKSEGYLSLLSARKGAKLPLISGQIQGLGFWGLFHLLLHSGPWCFNGVCVIKIATS